MSTILAQAEGVFLLSVFKPIVTVLLVAGWGWVVMKLDKDAGYFYLPRVLCNIGLLAVGALAFFLLLAVPLFAVGLLMWLLLVGGSFAGYAFYRNTKVPPEHKWTLSLESFRRKVEDMQQAQATHRAAVKLIGPGDKPATVPGPRDPHHAGYVLLDEMLYHALERGAERLSLKVEPDAAASRYRIDGVAYPGPEVDPAVGLQLIDFVKGVAKLDVEDRRKKQTATIKANSDDLGIHRLDLTTSGSTRGVTLTLDVDDDRRHDFNLENVGLLASQKQQLDAALEGKGGVAIVSATPGQGSSTLLYRLLERHDPYMQGVSAMEVDHTLELEGVSSETLDPSLSSQDLHEKVAAHLRGDPDVLLLDFEPAKTTAQLIAKTAEDIRFYLDFDQPSSLHALKKWASLVGDRKLAGSGLRVIVSMRLLRKLCTTCRIAYKPDPAALKKLGLPADRVSQLHRASGKVEVKGKPQPCPDCHGLGYRGRTGVFEVMPFDEQARTMVAAGDMDQLKSHLRKQKMMYLQEAALARVVEGVTDIKEVSRVLDADAKNTATANA